MTPQTDFLIPNTLSLASRAAWGGALTSLADVQRFVAFAKAQQLPCLVLGEGSNIVTGPEVNACVGLSRITGIRVLEENPEWVRLEIGAGENWHHLVMTALANGWNGLENLALIPGSVGAAPIQNIGAYGVEISQFVQAVVCVDEAGAVQRLASAECQFAYRDSVFKRRGELVITTVELQLHKHLNVNLSYPDVARWCAEQGVVQPTPSQIAGAVMDIRQKKLPDPEQMPNVGSFFKNPVLPASQAQALRQTFPQLSLYAQPDSQQLKLSAAQLIDIAGCKALSQGPVQLWQKQPLVLVNRGGGTCAQVLALATRIQQRVNSRFGVWLEIEPTLLTRLG